MTNYEKAIDYLLELLGYKDSTISVLQAQIEWLNEEVAELKKSTNEEGGD